MKKIFLSVLLTGLFFNASHGANAQKEFNIDLHNNYSITSDGTTYVEYVFLVENLTPTTHISKYTLELTNTNIRNIQVTNNDQLIEHKEEFTPEKAIIEIDFPDEVLGEGKKRQFTISYINNDLATIYGNVLEVAIPQLANYQTYDSHDITLYTPRNFGEPSRINLNDYQATIEDNQIKMEFDQTQGQGITAIFGKEQFFEANIKYQLYNTQAQTALFQIALPPDTKKQVIHYQKLNPKPEEIDSDEDGNWLATYKLAPNQSLSVEADLNIKLLLESREEVPDTDLSDHYLKETQYWKTSDPIIQQMLEKIKKEKTDTDLTYAIYQFTVNNLNYTTNILDPEFERRDAVEALSHQNDATCQEYTDVFITLARAANIPARQVVGYAHSEDETLRPIAIDQDILHAWPEYYSQEKKQWIAVDPTWEHTTNGVDYYHQFDLNHIAFVINGLSDSKPYPAGSYLKEEEDQKKKIEIDFAQDFPEIAPNLSVNFYQKKIGKISLPGLYEVTVQNNTGLAWYNLKLEVKRSDNKTSLTFNQNQQPIKKLLPFQTVQLPINVYNNKNWLSKESMTLKLLIPAHKDTTQTYEILSFPKITRYIYHEKGITYMATASVIIALIAGSLFIFRRKK